MRSTKLRARTSLAAVGGSAVLALGAILAASPASAATPQLGGDWSSFNRCPVDNPAMLAADGTNTVAQCISSTSPSGSITLGNTTVPIGATDVQFGAVENTADTSYTLIPPAAGTVISPSVNVPGGLLGLMCPSNILVVTGVCNELANSSLNTVTATVESAGAPSGFTLTSGLSVGSPIVTIPVVIKLSNPLLASTCEIGSTSNPILLKPENSVRPSISVARFDDDGTPDTAGDLTRIGLTGGTQSDTTFSVPGANGCGLLGLADLAVDAKISIPASSGNSITLNNTSTYLAGLTAPGFATPSDGAALSAAWHTAAGQ